MTDVDIELHRLREMHPRLPSDLALLMIERAALALERNGHLSGVNLAWEFEQADFDGTMSWPEAGARSRDQHDEHRITEDGAETIALILAHWHQESRVVRRLQRGEHADWLLESFAEGRRALLALEISGVDRGSIAARVASKLIQVSRCDGVDQRWVGVVGFEAPTATLRSTRES
jgi:hypothetical protein